MNNTQLYLIIGVPSFVALISWVTVILAWLSNRSDIHRLNDKVDHLAESLRGEMIAFRREVHSDLMMLHERVVKVETRQDN